MSPPPPGAGKIAALRGVAFRISPEEERPIEGEDDGLFLLVPLSPHFLAVLPAHVCGGEIRGRRVGLTREKRYLLEKTFSQHCGNLDERSNCCISVHKGLLIVLASSQTHLPSSLEQIWKRCCSTTTPIAQTWADGFRM